MNGNNWFRFVGAAGTKLQTIPNPLSLKNQHACHTHGVAWLKGNHPTISEGIVLREICFAYHGLECYTAQWQITYPTNVIACESSRGNFYYVYQLRSPVDCTYAYCAE